MSKKFVVILNAPPGSGKDSAAAYLQSRGIATHQEFKKALVGITKSIFNLTNEQWVDISSRDKKEVPSPLLMGMSPRNALIMVSEEVIKPVFGKDFFGIAAASQLVEGINVFSDGGFVDEVKCLVSEVGYENVLVVRIKRDGCSFDNDSRDYLPDALCQITIDFDNNGTLEDFHTGVEKLVTSWVDGTLLESITNKLNNKLEN